MSQARSNKDRLHQIARWLAVTFPTPYPVTLRCVKKIAALPGSTPIEKKQGDAGENYREGRKIVIRVAVRPGTQRAFVVDSLLHEWAHAVTMRHDVIEGRRTEHGGHDDEWGLAYGKIYRRFVDDGGCEASENY